MPEFDPLAGLQIPRADQNIMKGLTIDSGYGGMEKAVKGLGNLPGLTETILPSIKALLMPGENNPYAKLIDASTQKNVASAQTEAMKRGLTGSDIEAGMMSAERATGESVKTQFYADNSQQLAGFIKDLATGDIGAQRQNLIMFAELMGQKITSDQDLAMFREMLSANMNQAAKNRKSQMWGSGIGALGAIGGGLAMGAMISDARMKYDIRVIGKVSGLNIVEYRWNAVAQMFGAHDRKQIGVIAQDVEAKYPEAIKDFHGLKTVDFTLLPSDIFETVNRLGAAYA